MKSTFLSIAVAFAALTCQAQNTVNNFKVNVKVTQGIEDAGYLVQVFDKNQSQRKFLDKITVTDKRTSFETHIDEPLVGDLTAIFPDGTVCSACVRFPFVPGEQVDVKVKNGTFELSGTKFYQQWADADDLEENARKYYKKSETDSIILNYLKNHADDEGCVMRYWQYTVLPRQTILSIIPETMRNGRFKHFFDTYKPQASAAYIPATPITQESEIIIPESEINNGKVLDRLNPTQKSQMQLMGEAIKINMEAIKNLYEVLEDDCPEGISEPIFDQISERNKEMDKQIQDGLKMLKSMKVTDKELQQIYGVILELYANQDEGFSEWFKTHGMSKSAKKARKNINKLMEKYVQEGLKAKIKG